MLNIEQSLGLHSPKIHNRVADFKLKGVSVQEFLDADILQTASPWVQEVASNEMPYLGSLHSKILTSFVGQRIGDAVTSCRAIDEWRMPTVTELVTFSLEMNTITPIVSLASYEVGHLPNVPWIAYIRGDLLGMWPTSIILPNNSSVLLVKE